jgi:hypothetical protein
MSGRLAEVLGVAAIATVITVVMAAAVLRAPSERIFGMESVGRHHDPFTVMQQFERPLGIGMYSQPVTDFAGALLSRLSGPVAAYNWLVLLSFPLAAVTAYLLARHVALSHPAATVAALAYAFSPFHVAHAAYHPHIAQTQWLPLYLLALWRCLDAATPVAVAFLAVATMTVTLSNFYGGFIAAVMTPAAVGAYWLAMRPANKRPAHALSVTVLSLVLIAACGVAYASYAAHAVVLDPGSVAYPRTELFRYSARWWSYLVPPVAHPVFGSAAHRIWETAGVRQGLLEQQVTLGWGILALGGIAVGRWLSVVRSRHSACGVRVPVLIIVAFAAFLCSLSPERVIGTYVVAAPSALLYSVVPMFRSYARFGVIVHLMAALLAGIGVDFLRRIAGRHAQIACAVLVSLIAVEYAVSPVALWRDVLATKTQRWVTRQPGKLQALDCMSLNRNSQQSIQWLTGYRVLLASSPGECTEPNFAGKLAATGYTHLLVRRDTAEARWFAKRSAEGGLQVAADLDDGQVFAVTATPPTIYTAAMRGFFRRQHNDTRSWQWMAQDAAMTVANTGVQPILSMLAVELWAFQHTRTLELRLDGRRVQDLLVLRTRRVYEVGPITVTPGQHVLAFHAAEAPSVADGNVGRRPVSIAVGAWSWSERGEQP